MKKLHKKKTASLFAVFFLFFTAPLNTLNASATGGNILSPEADSSQDRFGGGYAVTGQIDNVGYTSVLYDATNGLPTSDANCILGSSDGHVYLGGYSGIIRYDGTTFERLTEPSGLTSGRGLFEDSRGRIWVATNDNGVVVIDGDDSIHYTYKDGLTSSSARVFSEDGSGNIYIGTTSGVCYVDTEDKLHVLSDSRVDGERILRLDADSSGTVYGYGGNGSIFKLRDGKFLEIYVNGDLGDERISMILADPDNAGKVYIGIAGDHYYYGNFGDSFSDMKKVDVSPLEEVHWLNYDCGRLFVSSGTTLGYVENDVFTVINDISIDNAIEMVTSDYQGNIWIASSTQGVMKLVTNNFVDLSKKAGLRDEVTNATCVYEGRVYLGTNNGLFIIEGNTEVTEDPLLDLIGDARVRCITEDNDGNLWIAVYNRNLGIICRKKDGEIINITTENGLVDNGARCVVPASDGSILAGTNGGLAVIKDFEVVSTFGAAEGIKNTVFLTVCEGDNGEIYAGSDGDGIYVIDNGKATKLDRDDGLTSDVVMRIKKDDVNGVYWLITSNSIEYMRDGVIKEVTTFPYNNNYDIYFDNAGNAWILSSYGIYMVGTDELLDDNVTDYRLYTIANGLTGTPTSNSYSYLDENGYLYIPERDGVCMVNIAHVTEGRGRIKTAIGSIYCDDELIVPDETGVYTIPSSDGRIKISASVMDYTMTNPTIRVFLEGSETDGIETDRSHLVPLEYTRLKYGDYVLHIQVLSNNGSVLIDDRYEIIKKPKFTELAALQVLILFVAAMLAGLVVWRILKGTVIQRQLNEIMLAKDEAERANNAKNSFLANMSHEIRTPINTIMGMDEMIIREDSSNVPKDYYMSIMNYALDIGNASEALLSLVNDLLDMSKIESGKMHLVEQEYDTKEMLRSIVSMIRVRSTQKELIFDVIVDETIPSRMYGDVSKIRQIVLNLLTNAVKYTDAGGFALIVSMDARENDKCTIRFSVKDTGIGVKEEDMEKLFSAYERLDEEKNSGIQGTGLGLDISKRFATLLGGTLECESTYGKGSEFILTIDQKIIDKTPMGVFIERDEEKARGSYVPKFIAPDADILVVDDNPMNLNVIRGLLKATKVFVTTVTSGEECLERIKDTKFNVVLLDHMMPGMDGVETVAKIREKDPDLPVYALTANTAVDEAFYISKGFNGYLSKPIDTDTLESTIMKHIPKEMMIEADVSDAEEEITEIPEEFKWLYDVEGIDVDEGIKNSGGVSEFLLSLNLFKYTIDDNTRVLKEALESDNIRLYTIKVHALKSSARIIGAKKLSELSKDLEDAGNSEDKAFIDSNTETLFEIYGEYKDKLKGLSDNEDDGDKEPIPESELKEAYRTLSEVIPQMDYDSVEMIVSDLKKYKLPKEDDEKIEELSKMLKVFDWDGMEKLFK